LGWHDQILVLSLSRAGQQVCQGLGPLAALATHDALTRPLREGLDQRVISALQTGGPAFQQARETLADAGKVRKGIESLGQTPPSPSLARKLARLDGLRASLQWGVELGLAAPDLLPYLLGFDAPRTYLILAQDNHELRATGGIIRGVGVMEVEQGRVTRVSFQDSYTVDDPSKPSPPLAPLRSATQGYAMPRHAVKPQSVGSGARWRLCAMIVTATCPLVRRTQLIPPLLT